MTKLTDGKKTVAISISMWDGTNLSQDISPDFFEVGALKRSEDVDDPYIVPDVDYCIDQASDWMNYTGDFDDPKAEKQDKEAGLERTYSYVLA